MEYIFTERAHLMCPNMCFGIIATINSEYDENRIKDVMEKASAVHPFLRATLGFEQDTNRYFYDVQDSSKIELGFGDEPVPDVDSSEVMKEYERLVGRDWNLFKEGMLKVIAWKVCKLDETNKLVPSNTTCLLFVFHHLLADGRGALGFVQEIAECYVKHSFEIIEREKLSEIIADGKNNSVSVNDMLLAKVFIEEQAGKIIIARDLREAFPFYVTGALGNYSTAFSISLKKKSTDRIAFAKEVHKKVQAALGNIKTQYLILQCYADLEPALLDASFMAAQGKYNSKAAAFIGKLFFGYDNSKGYSITNLGKITSGVIDSACFIPPASPAIRKTWGVLTVNDRLIICSSER